MCQSSLWLQGGMHQCTKHKGLFSDLTTLRIEDSQQSQVSLKGCTMCHLSCLIAFMNYQLLYGFKYFGVDQCNIATHILWAKSSKKMFVPMFLSTKGTIKLKRGMYTLCTFFFEKKESFIIRINDSDFFSDMATGNWKF